MDTNADRIAVLIDADNTSHAYANDVLSEVAKYGNPTIKRVYGDWSNTHLTRWARKLNSLGLRAMHQNAFTKGKNSTDLALVIDAMDLLYDGNVEAFALVTSDSDFTSLAHRLRESGKAVYVLGTQKAPDALKYACDKFIELEFLEADEEEDDESAEDGQEARPTPPINLQSAITRALNAVAGDDGWSSLSALGSQLNRTHPSFDSRAFGHARLSTLVTDQPYLETTGEGNAMRIRLKGQRPAKKEPARSEPAKKEPAKREPAKKTPAKKAAPKKTAVPEKTAEPEVAETPEPPRPVVTKRTRTSRRKPAAGSPDA